MLESQKHRGPNHSGHFFDHSRKIFLGHTRLSILDLSEKAHGPFESSCKNAVITFNGEIYNAPSLKREIESQFHNLHFKTKNSDTEVLLNAYLAFGFDVFDRIEGMFAFIIVDLSQNKIILGRDHFGQKPLHYSHLNGCLTASSELTPHRILHKTALHTDRLALAKFWAYDTIPAPKTLYREVAQVPPATFMEFDLKTLEKKREKRYWTPSFRRVPSKEIDCDYLTTLISASVKRCTLSDTPLALFLSGGLDSSLVGYFLKREVPHLESLNMSMGEKSYDETPFAKRAAAILNTRHSTSSFDDFAPDEQVISFYENLDAPNGDSGLMPSWALAQKMSERFKVAVGGDGGDETFFGYDPHIAFYGMGLLSKLAPFDIAIKALLKSLAPRWPLMSHKRLPLGLKLQRLSRSLQAPPPYSAALMMSSLDTVQINRLLGLKFAPEEIFSEALSFWERTDSPCDEDRFNSYFLHIYLPNKVLAKVDRASMLNGLEVRAPLLDKDLFEYCSTLPLRHFHNGWRGKLPQRKLASRFIGKAIAQKPKGGFGSSVSTLVERPLIAQRIRSLRDVDSDFLSSLAQDHARRRGDYGQALWNGFVFSFFD